MTILAEKDIRDQLDRILGSVEFSTAKRLSDFLKFIVSETLAKRGASLQAYLIALEVFDRAPDFNPQTDTIVRVQAGQLRLRLEEYYAQSGRDDPVRIRVPKGGYVPSFTQHEVPEKTKSVETEIGDSTPSIIVLPFSNLNEGTEKDYFSLGLTEDILAALSSFSDVKLYARNLTTAKLGPEVDIIAFARSLNVRFLLDGSVRHVRNGVRISVRLLDVETSKILWNNTFDRGSVAADIFDAENEIAAKIAAEIAGPSGDIARHDLLEASRRPPETMGAYDAVLRAYDYLHNPDCDTHKEVTALLEAAVQTDPEYSDAAMMLSRMYLDEDRFSYNVKTTVEDARGRAVACAKQAIKYAPNNAVAWLHLSLAYFAKREFELFLQAGERSLSLSPNHPEILARFGGELWIIGQIDRGLKMTEKALSLTPFSPGSYYFTYVHDAFFNGRDEQALHYALKLEADDLFWTHFILAAIYGQLGRRIDAQTALNKVFELNPGFRHLTTDYINLSWPFRPAFKARLIDGLKKAGHVFPV